METKEIIQSSLDYIEENLYAELTAQELANLSGFSLFHYYHLFRSVTGLPVMQYILRRRLIHAIYAVRCGSTRIEAALTYGFNTYSGFYKAFVREFGCTPSAYLRLRRAKHPVRVNLKKENVMFVSRKKAENILKNWHLDTQSVQEIYYDTGEQNDHAYYVGKEYVLKFTTQQTRLARHIELSHALEAIGLCAATVVLTSVGSESVRDGDGFFYLTHRLSGNQIIPEELYHGDSAEKARFIGNILGQLHQALAILNVPVQDADLCGSLSNWALPEARNILNLSDAFCQNFLDVFTSLYSKLPQQIIHRDPNPGNIIRSQDRWGFIDFELSERNARLFDPCYAATAILSETFDASDTARLETWFLLYQNLMQGYDSIVHLTDTEWTAIPYLLLANQFLCTAWFSDQDRDSESFENNCRMTLWLVDQFERLKIHL